MKIKLEVTHYKVVRHGNCQNKVYGIVDDIMFMAQREEEEDKECEEWEWGNGISAYYRYEHLLYDKDSDLELNAKGFDDLRRKYKNIFTDALDQWERSYWKHYKKNVEIATFGWATTSNSSVEDANCDFGYKKETRFHSVMSNDQRMVMEFVFQYEREKWNNGKWSPKVSQIIQHMKDDFNWHDQYTQSVINEMESEGLVAVTSKYEMK